MANFDFEVRKNSQNVPYAVIPTPEGEFRVYAEQEDDFHGVYVMYVQKGQEVEQSLCVAEVDPDDSNLLSVKVWSNADSEEYQEDIKIRRYFDPECPYCGETDVDELDYDVSVGEAKYKCCSCEKDFLLDLYTGKYTTRNRMPIKEE